MTVPTIYGKVSQDLHHVVPACTKSGASWEKAINCWSLRSGDELLKFRYALALGSTTQLDGTPHVAGIGCNIFQWNNFFSFNKIHLYYMNILICIIRTETKNIYDFVRTQTRHCVSSTSEVIHRNSRRRRPGRNAVRKQSGWRFCRSETPHVRKGPARAHGGYGCSRSTWSPLGPRGFLPYM